VARRLRSHSPARTREIGRRLAQGLGPGSVVCLYGELGSGKTVFVKGMAQALGIPERQVGSASFVLVAEHLEGSLPLYHVDLYRLQGPEEAEALALEEYFEGPGITVVEWADRLGSPPQGAVRVHIRAVSERTREIIIEGLDEEGGHNS